jgi:hypothetical protein
LVRAGSEKVGERAGSDNGQNGKNANQKNEENGDFPVFVFPMA